MVEKLNNRMQELRKYFNSPTITLTSTKKNVVAERKDLAKKLHTIFETSIKGINGARSFEDLDKIRITLEKAITSCIYKIDRTKKYLVFKANKEKVEIKKMTAGDKEWYAKNYYALENKNKDGSNKIRNNLAFEDLIYFASKLKYTLSTAIHHRVKPQEYRSSVILTSTKDKIQIKQESKNCNKLFSDPQRYVELQNKIAKVVKTPVSSTQKEDVSDQSSKFDSSSASRRSRK